MFRRRKQKKEIQLVNVAQRSEEAVIEAGINEKYAPKTSSEVKAKRRAVRSMSFQHSFKRREPVEPKQEKAPPKKISQPDLLRGTPRNELPPQPLTMPDAKLKLVTMPGEDTKKTGVFTSRYSMKIFPAEWGHTSQGSKLKYRHSTYVSSKSSFGPPPVMKKPSKKSEKESIQEEEVDVQVLHFDDTKPSSHPKSRPLSSYDPNERDRTNTATSTFDVSYEL